MLLEDNPKCSTCGLHLFPCPNGKWICQWEGCLSYNKEIEVMRGKKGEWEDVKP